MAYPQIPLAYVPFLSSISRQRNELPDGPAHVTVMAHHDKSVNPLRFEIRNDDNWNEMLATTVNLFNQGPVDTMLVFFPTSDKGIDAGYLVEGGKPTMFLQWTHDQNKPFAILVLEDVDADHPLANAVGLDTLKGLLDKVAAGPNRVLPGIGTPLTAPQVRFDGMPGRTPAANS